MLEKINFNDKRVKIGIIVISVILALAILFCLGNVVSYLSNLGKNEVYASNATGVEFHDELASDSDIIVLENFSTSKPNESNCVNGICVSEVNMSCYNNRGIINYRVTNNTDFDKSGYLKIIFGDNEYTAIVYYSAVNRNNFDNNNQPLNYYNGYSTYEDYDLRNINKEYRVESLDSDDIYGMTTFVFSSLEEYYKIESEGNSNLS